VRIAVGLALDIAAIVLFAAIGRRSHGETGALIAIGATAWPFLAGVAAGWLIVLVAVRRVPLSVGDGIRVWLCAVGIGMVLRALTHAGTAFSFVIVATLFLCAALLGWRAAAALMTRQRMSQSV